jgi:ureidoglycolate dehydrogenase (NAD+)
MLVDHGQVKNLAYDISHVRFRADVWTAPVTSGRTISIPGLKAFCSDAFERAGLDPQDAETGAEVLSTTDAWGVFTHGSKALRGYLKRLYAGGLRARGRPRVTSEGPAWGLVDGASSLGMVTSVFAMKLAISKACDAGMAYVGVRNSCHFGAAGYYAALAADEGLIGLSMANDIPSVAAPGSRSAVTGSNPLAYAVPAGRHRPLMLDMSIATVAGGKVYAARERGERIPATWLIGQDGLPTDDTASFPEHSVLTPAAAHKGFGLALLIESLAGCLSGAASTWQIGSWLGDDPARPTFHGAAFLAVDATTISSDLPRRVEHLIDEVHAAPRAVGVDRLYVPGELEWERFAASTAEGIDLPADVVASLRDAAALSDLDLGRYLESG